MLQIINEFKEIINEIELIDYLKKENSESYFEFSKQEYLIKLVDNDKKIYLIKRKDQDAFVLFGDQELLPRIVNQIIYLGLECNAYLMNDTLALKFNELYTNILFGEFKTKKYLNNYILGEYQKGSIKWVVLAGGCFWCAAKPYYEYTGIKKVLSGYTGGNKTLPTYAEVKSQSTHHLEAIKLIYDSRIISLKEILDIYFDTIDPFDDGGQFIDRGESYTTAIFYNNETDRLMINDYIKNKQKDFEQEIKVKVVKETVFYMAEEYHQDYAVKNPELMEKELIESGRIKG